jgi:uncharacterized Fe-S radical SAM superfamily protein PflX
MVRNPLIFQKKHMSFLLFKSILLLYLDFYYSCHEERNRKTATKNYYSIILNNYEKTKPNHGRFIIRKYCNKCTVDTNWQ